MTDKFEPFNPEVKRVLNLVRDFEKRNKNNPGLVVSEHDVSIIALAGEIFRLQNMIKESDK